MRTNPVGRWIQVLRGKGERAAALENDEEIDRSVSEAFVRHRSGDLAAARELYQQILAKHPANADALYLLATIERSNGEIDAAIARLERAITANPRVGAFYQTLAGIHQERGDPTAAEKYLRTALQLEPDNAGFHNDLGTVLALQGRGADDTSPCFRRAIELDATLAAAHFNLALELSKAECLAEAKDHLLQAHALHPGHLGCTLKLAIVCRQLGEAREAEGYFAAALELDPSSVDARMGRAELCFNERRLAEASMFYREILAQNPRNAAAQFGLGCCFDALEQRVSARVCYEEAIALDPAHAAANINLASLHQKNGNHADAVAACQRVLDRDPNFAPAYVNLASALTAQGKTTEAVRVQKRGLEIESSAAAFSNLASCQYDLGEHEGAVASATRAIELDPGYVQAYINKAAAWEALGDQSAALAAYETALKLDPESAAAHRDRGCMLLLLGDYEHGWREYEWRWNLPSFAGYRARYGPAKWDGSRQLGRTLLIHTEQGAGDSIHFARFIPEAVKRVGRVLVHCPASLARLLASVSAEVTVVSDDRSLPSYDFHAGIMSLPTLLGCTLEKAHGTVPYLSAPPESIRSWRDVLRACVPGGDLKIGVVWAGNPAFKRDRQRSCALAQFAPVGLIPGVTLLSLQHGPAAAQAVPPPSGMRIVDLAARFTDFADTAGLIDSLDLVLTVDTAIAHLAGALNKPVWTLLPFAPDFRWLLAREDSPWYPSMRLFRQRTRGDWGDVFARVTVSLQELARRHRADTW